MRPILLSFLIAANVLTSIIFVALGSSLFIFPNTEISQLFQSYTGIYVVFVLLCICEVIKWFTFKEALEFKYDKARRFFPFYGIVLVLVSIVYQFYYLSLVGILYIVCYFIVRKTPENSNIIIEKEVDGQPSPSDSLFRPLPKDTDSD